MEHSEIEQNGYGTPVKNDDKPTANPFVVLREEFDDWAVLFNPDTGYGFGLNPTGVYLWKLLDGEHTLDALLEEIRHRTEGVPEEASDHVVAFVDDLFAQGFVSFDETGCGLSGTPDRRALHPGKSSSYALRFQCREVVKDKRLCGTNKKIAYEKPTLIDFAGVRDAAYETVTVAVRQGQPAQSALAGVTQTHSAGVGIRPPSPTV